MQRRYGDEWERLTALYLTAYPEDILKPPNDEFSAFPTPRSWTNTGRLLHKYNNVSWELKESLIIGNLGEEVGVKFAALLRTNIDINEALRKLEENPKFFGTLTLNQRLLVLNAIAQQSVDKLATAFRGFLAYLAEEHREMLVILTLLLNREKRSAVVTKLHNVFIKVANEIMQYL